MLFPLARNTVLATVIGSVTIATIQPAFADNSAVRSTIQRNYNQINSAFIRQDLNGATAYFTSDFESINAKGERESLSEFKEKYNSLFKRFNIKLTSSKTTIKSISVKPGSANVAISQRTEGKVAGSFKIIISQTSNDTWVKTPEGWRLQTGKILTSKATVNGRTVPF